MGRRILICNTFYPPGTPGGAELVAQHQAEALSELGNSVSVFCGDPVPRRQRYEVWKEQVGPVPVYKIKIDEVDLWVRSSTAFYDPRKEAAFEEVIRQVTPEIVHFHNLNGLSAGLIRVASRNGARTILTVHDHWAFCLHNTLLRTAGDACADRSRCQTCFDDLPPSRGVKLVPTNLRNEYIQASYRLVDAVVSPSRYLAAAYEQIGIPRSKIHVIPNGVPFELFRPRTRRTRLCGPVRFAFVGYLGIHKGVDILLRAFARRRIADQARLQFVGEGHLRSRLEQMVRELDLLDKVSFTGAVEHGAVADVLRSSDCLILPSVWPENHPGSLTEALRMGVPVIAPRIGGIPEIVDELRTGLLFRPGDEQDLAAKMHELIRDPELGPRMGRNGRRRMANNSVLRRAGQISELYAGPPHEDLGRASVLAPGGDRHGA